MPGSLKGQDAVTSEMWVRLPSWHLQYTTPVRTHIMELPIDISPEPGPLRFRWKQLIDTAIGPRSQVCEGPLNVSAEPALAALIRIAKEQAAEIDDLRKQVQAHCDRIASQSDQLSKCAEVQNDSVAGRPNIKLSVRKSK